MKAKVATEPTIGTLFHCLLFAQQKAIKDVLGSGTETFVQPMLESIARIGRETKMQMFELKDMDEAVASFSSMLIDRGIVKNFKFTETGKNKYLLKIEGCLWAKSIHKELKPRDETCPLALIVMAMYRKCMGEKVRETDSKYLADGIETELEPLFQSRRSTNPAKSPTRNKASHNVLSTDFIEEYLSTKEPDG